jgi:hypothetical protein
MSNGTDRPAAPSSASCTVPLKIRLIGRPSEADLARLEDTVCTAVARRLVTARQTLSSLQAGPRSVFGRRPAVKKTKRRAVIRHRSRAAARPKIDPRDRAEFALIKLELVRERVGTKTKLVKRPMLAGAHGPITTVEGYLAQRRRTFKGDAAHPDDAYWAFAKASDAELAANPALRHVLEYDLQPAAQTVFYRWVRKAYLDWVRSEHLDPSIAADIPGVVLRAEGRADLLRNLVKREGIAAYGSKKWAAMHLSVQGFNPRPEKGGGRFRLGTLSEHAFGAAVDIDPDHNPQLSLAQWRWIEKVGGRKVARDPERWRTDPKAIWQEIKELNDAFVEEIARRITEEEDRRRIAEWASRLHLLGPPDAPVPGMSLRTDRAAPPHGLRLLGPWPVDVVFKGHEDLIPYRAGFFTLEWDLVKRLHDHGLVWGAIFQPPSRVDLHHFQLPEGRVQGEEESHARQIREWFKILHRPQPQVPPPGFQLPLPNILEPEGRLPFHLLHPDLPPPALDEMPPEGLR